MSRDPSGSLKSPPPRTPTTPRTRPRFRLPTMSAETEEASTTVKTKKDPPKPKTGGIDDGIPWVGGDPSKSSTTPVDILCYRPSDFRSKQRQHDALKQGLDEARRLELPGGSENKSSLVTWIQEMKLLCQNRGFDTVFYIKVSRNGTDEFKYLMSDWGAVTAAEVSTYIKTLTDPYDLENCRLSAWFQC